MLVISLLCIRFQADRNGVDAVPQVGGRGAVREDMPEVGATGTAPHLRPDHAVGSIPDFLHGVPADGFKITGPTTAGMEFRIGTEQRTVTADAVIDSGLLGVGVFSCKRRLGAALHTDVKLIRGQPGCPIGAAFSGIRINSGGILHGSTLSRMTQKAREEGRNSSQARLGTAS